MNINIIIKNVLYIIILSIIIYKVITGNIKHILTLFLFLLLLLLFAIYYLNLTKCTKCEGFEPIYKTKKIKNLKEELDKFYNNNTNEDEDKTEKIILQKCENTRKTLTEKDEIDEYNIFMKTFNSKPIKEDDEHKEEISKEEPEDNNNFTKFNDLTKTNPELVYKIMQTLDQSSYENLFKLDKNKFNNLLNELNK
jgi:hypothetical protein